MNHQPFDDFTRRSARTMGRRSALLALAGAVFATARGSFSAHAEEDHHHDDDGGKGGQGGKGNGGDNKDNRDDKTCE